MRLILTAVLALSSLNGAWAQGLPSGGLPPGMSAADAMALYQNLSQQQRQMLVVQGVQGKSAVNPGNALAWYQSLTPQQKQAAREWAKQNPSAAAAYKEQAKSMLKSLRGN